LAANAILDSLLDSLGGTCIPTDWISEEVNSLKATLLEKNAAYGNAAAEPVRIFSKLDPLAQLYVRMDDKMSRIIKGQELAGEDAKWDLAGYLILERIIKRHQVQ
jgi:hypothetical protein